MSRSILRSMAAFEDASTVAVWLHAIAISPTQASVAAMSGPFAEQLSLRFRGIIRPFSANENRDCLPAPKISSVYDTCSPRCLVDGDAQVNACLLRSHSCEFERPFAASYG